MPIIKDKYKGKGSDIRSKFVTRENNRALINPVPVGLSTEQIKEIETKQYRDNPANASQVTTLTQSNKDSVVYSFLGSSNVNTLNTAKLIITLKSGSNLNDIVINNTSSVANVVSLAWSSGSQENASIVASSGLITSSNNNATTFFSATFPGEGSLSLSHVVNNIFRNVNKDVYIYAVTSVSGNINITYNILNG
jgi:hypothetical protein